VAEAAGVVGEVVLVGEEASEKRTLSLEAITTRSTCRVEGAVTTDCYQGKLAQKLMFVHHTWPSPASGRTKLPGGLQPCSSSACTYWKSGRRSSYVCCHRRLLLAMQEAHQTTRIITQQRPRAAIGTFSALILRKL
jgi:hypothetical protein